MKPFNMIIAEMTGCGKTHYLLKMLESEYRGHFDLCFLLCPTFERNQTYQDWKFIHEKNFNVLPCTHDDEEYYIKYVFDYVKSLKDKKALNTIDDCASTQSVENKTSALVTLGFSGRHFGINTVVITQQYTSIAKACRENAMHVVSFYNDDAIDRKLIFDRYLADVSKEQVNRIIQQLKTTPHARLEILKIPPYGWTIKY